MEHKFIKVGLYIADLSLLYSFYRYSYTALSEPKIVDKIVNQEIASMTEVLIPYLKNSANKSQIEKLTTEYWTSNIYTTLDKGLHILRGQLLESAFSTFEKFLCHVLRIYLYAFPNILKNIDKNIAFKEIIDNQNSIFNFIVELEIEGFSRKSLSEKKDYLRKNLKINNDATIWIKEGQEMWKDINKKRQAIVHKEAHPNISEEYLLKAINYLQKVMLGIALISQAEHGIPAEGLGFETYIKLKEPPSL